MTKVYIVTGITDYKDGGNEIKEVLYAGLSESKAKKINIDLPYTELTLEVFVDDLLIKKYSKTDIYEWNTEFDLLEKLRKELFESELKSGDIKMQIIRVNSLIWEGV